MAMMKRAGQLTARKSVSTAEAGLSDVWRTDCGRLNQETVHVAMCAALKSTYCTMYGYKTFWGDDAILVDLID